MWMSDFSRSATIPVLFPLFHACTFFSLLTAMGTILWLVCPAAKQRFCWVAKSSCVSLAVTGFQVLEGAERSNFSQLDFPKPALPLPPPTGMATQYCCVWVSTPSHRNLCKETFWQLIPMHRVWESFRERLWPHRVPCLHVFFPSEHSDCCSFCWFFTF